jgi:hypothetical protein
MLKKVLCLALSFCLYGLAVFSEDYTDVIEKSFNVDGRPDLLLRNEDGVIQITPHEKPVVEIKITRTVRGAKSEAEAKKEMERVSIELEQSVNQVRAIAKWRSEGLRIGPRPSIDIRFEVYTPSKSDVRAEVSDGELYLSGLQGTLDLNASDGNIDAADLSGDIRISSSDGEIDLKRSTGKMDISLSDGDLRSQNCSGHVRIRSGDGSVELTSFDGEAEISNVDGEVLVDGILKGMKGKVSDGDMTIKVAPGSMMESNWTLSASDGGIVLDLPDDFSADLDVSTADGHVETDHPVSVVGRLSTRRLTGKIRQGGHLLQIKTSDGDVAIK